MSRIGFSTGALALSDFSRGIDLQRREGIDAIELSALREQELPELLRRLTSLDLSWFKYCSFHAPSALREMTSACLVETLSPVVEARLPIIVHPDIIGDDFTPWRKLGELLLLENMDTRKRVCRTVPEMRRFFTKLPEARFCFDIGHARQVDSTMSVAAEFLLEFRERLVQLHISEVSWDCRHRRISTASALAFQSVARWIPDSVPIVIESVIEPSQIEDELRIVRNCLDWRTPLFGTSQVTPETAIA